MGRQRTKSRLQRERCEDDLGKQYCSVAAVAAVAAVGGAAISSQGAKSAANAQSDSAAASNMLQQYMFDKNVQLQQPAINAGNTARDSLLYRLGLSRTGVSGGAGPGGQVLTASQLRDQLTPQFTRQVAATGPNAGQPVYKTGQQAIAANPNDPLAAFKWAQSGASDGVALDSRGVPFTGAGNGPGYWENGGISESTGNPERSWVSTAGPQYNSEIDQSGLQAEIDRRLAEQSAAQQAYQDQLAGNNQFGDLGEKFQFNTYTPDTFTPDTYTAPDPYVADKFSYTGEDLYKDPSYLFRLQQGQKALDRQGAASGRYLSGAQLQAASDYNQGAASTEFQNAYQRALGTFGTNEGNRKNAYDTNTTNGLNAFNTNETNKYNAFSTNSANKFNAFNTNETNRYNAYQSNFNNAVNPLLSLAGSATLGSQALGQAGQQTAQLMGANLQGAANATGAAGIASSNAINSGVNNAVNTYQSNQLLNQLLNRGNTTPTTGVNNNPVGLGGLDASTVYGAGSGWGQA